MTTALKIRDILFDLVLSCEQERGTCGLNCLHCELVFDAEADIRQRVADIVERYIAEEADF